MADEPDKPPEGSDKPGGVSHDSRGNAVWQWAASTGRQALDSTSALLKKLDVPGLKLQDDDKPAFRDHDPEQPPGKGSGYNPYGTRAQPGKPSPPTKPTPAARPATGANTRLPPVEVPKSRPSLLGRLFGRK